MGSLTRIIRIFQQRCYATCSRNLTLSKAPNPTIVSLVNSASNPWVWRKNDEIQLPLVSKIPLDFPNSLKYVPVIDDEHRNLNIELPPSNDVPSKEAARLIVIRRKKMKRHKLKKLRKRMKYEWAKRRQRRELKKEKDFQAVLIKQCKEGEAFSAEKYVAEKLAKFNEVLAARNVANSSKK